MLLLIRGASESAKVNAVMVLIKLGVLVLFIVIGLTRLQRRPLRQLLGRRRRRHQRRGRARSSSPSSVWTPWRPPARRSRDPQKALPRAIIGALVIVVTVYVLVAIAGVGAQPVE